MKLRALLPKPSKVTAGGGSLLLKRDSAEVDGTNTLEDAELLPVGASTTVEAEDRDTDLALAIDRTIGVLLNRCR